MRCREVQTRAQNPRCHRVIEVCAEPPQRRPRAIIGAWPRNRYTIVHEPRYDVSTAEHVSHNI